MTKFISLVALGAISLDCLGGIFPSSPRKIVAAEIQTDPPSCSSSAVEAVANENFAQLKSLYQSGETLDCIVAKSRYGQSLLQEALGFSKSYSFHSKPSSAAIQIVKFLVQVAHVNIRHPDANGVPAIALAAKSYDFLKILVEAGAPVENLYRDCVLYYGNPGNCAQSGYPSERISPLMIASAHSELKAVEYLLAKGASVNLPSSSGRNALAFAISAPWLTIMNPENPRMEVIRLLLDHGARADMYARYFGRAHLGTPLENFLKTQCDPTLTDRLLRAGGASTIAESDGAALRATLSAKGCTRLHYPAAEFPWNEVDYPKVFENLRLLRQSGADINQRASVHHRDSPLFAIRDDKILQFALQHFPVDLGFTNDRGNTALMERLFAYYRSPAYYSAEDLRLLTGLAKSGTSLKVTNAAGLTACDMASKQFNDEVLTPLGGCL